MPSDPRLIEQLNAHMGLPGAVRFEPGVNGLVRAVLTTSNGAEAHVYLHGGHVAHFQPAGQKPALFLSQASNFVAGKPIRGGVPVCFPWFGPKADDPAAAMHGFARDRQWKFKTVERLPDGSVSVVLVLKWSAATQHLWPHRFTLTHTVTLDARGDRLAMDLACKNLNTPDVAPIKIEAALHTYLAVSDIHQVQVTGLENAQYIDKVDAFARKQQGGEPITFTGETDRVYLNTTAACAVHDPGWSRRIHIEKSGSNTTVVWNPWINKAKAMADFGDEEWPGMVCVETANAADNALTLKAKQMHVMKAVVRVEAM